MHQEVRPARRLHGPLARARVARHRDEAGRGAGAPARPPAGPRARRAASPPGPAAARRRAAPRGTPRAAAFSGWKRPGRDVLARAPSPRRRCGARSGRPRASQPSRRHLAPAATSWMRTSKVSRSVPVKSMTSSSLRAGFGPYRSSGSLAPVHGERAQEADGAEVVVGVEVGEEDGRHVEAGAVADHLPLRPLAAVDEEELALRAAPRGRSGSAAMVGWAAEVPRKVRRSTCPSYRRAGASVTSWPRCSARWTAARRGARRRRRPPCRGQRPPVEARSSLPSSASAG